MWLKKKKPEWGWTQARWFIKTGFPTPHPTASLRQCLMPETTACLGGSVPSGVLGLLMRVVTSFFRGECSPSPTSLSQANCKDHYAPVCWWDRLCFLCFSEYSQWIHALPTLRAVSGLCGSGSYWFASWSSSLTEWELFLTSCCL